MTDEITKQSQNRRQLLKGIGGLAAIGSVAQLVGCGGTNNGTTSSAPSSAPASSSSSVASSSSSLASSSSSSVASSSSSAPFEGWLTGGTNSMRANFPPLSPFGNSNVCQVKADINLGPCYFDRMDNGDDISDGQPGLPMVFAIKVVDRSCNPISGVDVEIWHTNNDGVYSINTSQATQRSGQGGLGGGAFNGNNICTNPNDQQDFAESQAGRWFRGVRTTNSEGIAYFISCLPAAYPPSTPGQPGLRCTHVHARFAYQGRQQLTTQFCFDENLLDEIYAEHPEYDNPSNRRRASNDWEFNGVNFRDYMFTSEKQDDGSLLSYITVGIDFA